MKEYVGILLVSALFISSFLILFWTSDAGNNTSRMKYILLDFARKDEVFSPDYGVKIREDGCTKMLINFDNSTENQCFGLFKGRDSWVIYTPKRKVWWDGRLNRALWKHWYQMENKNYEQFREAFRRENSDLYGLCSL